LRISSYSKKRRKICCRRCTRW